MKLRKISNTAFNILGIYLCLQSFNLLLQQVSVSFMMTQQDDSFTKLIFNLIPSIIFFILGLFMIFKSHIFIVNMPYDEGDLSDGIRWLAIKITGYLIVWQSVFKIFIYATSLMTLSSLESMRGLANSSFFSLFAQIFLFIVGILFIYKTDSICKKMDND